MPLVPIRKTNAAFYPFAVKINQIIAILNSMKGANGIKVNLSDSNLVISRSSSAKSTGSGASSGGTRDELHYAVSPVQIDIDGDGFFYTNTTLNVTVTVASNGFRVKDEFSGHENQLSKSALSIYNAVDDKLLYVPNIHVTQDMGVKEIDVCDSGTPKKMLIIASLPY